jgi:xanthine dehydrogenase YagS FAD-binding subunit
MNRFDYANPKTVKDAVALLAANWGESDVLAGGTDLLSLMKDYIHTPKRVVNIKGIAELGGISRRGGAVRIGATVTLDELAANAIVKQSFPALTQAALGVSSPQIRNMGTVGGDLCQRPRCWYFRRGFGLLAKGPNGVPLVPSGQNKYHSIFGAGPAYFVSASSLGPALVALGATVKIAGPSGSTFPSKSSSTPPKPRENAKPPSSPTRSSPRSSSRPRPRKTPPMKSVIGKPSTGRSLRPPSPSA